MEKLLVKKAKPRLTCKTRSGRQPTEKLWATWV